MNCTTMTRSINMQHYTRSHIRFIWAWFAVLMGLIAL
jgi:hypothetical protein